jgi:RHS repeat-associated protein
MAANDNELMDLPLAVAEASSLYMVQTDHLGRPTRMTDAAKSTVWQAAYNPHGEATSLSGTAALNLRFPGQVFQIETGLAYNWHRHYDATTGRYTQPDPLRFVDGPSIYAYAGNSPYMYVDRDGLIKLPEDPTGLSGDWQPDPSHQNPKGSRWRRPGGGCLDFEPGTPGELGWKGKPHWHDCSDPDDDKRKDKHWKPGEDCPQPADSKSSPFDYLPPPILIPGPGGAGGFKPAPFKFDPTGLQELLN